MMNDYETIYSSSPVEMEADKMQLAVATANLVTYIKKEMNIDILENENVSSIKRYVEADTIEFTFNYKNKMYIATYFKNNNEYDISTLIL